MNRRVPRGLKWKNVAVASGLTSFVFGVYFYTMRAVGGSDELQTAIDKFEHHKPNDTGPNQTNIPSKV